MTKLFFATGRTTCPSVLRARWRAAMICAALPALFAVVGCSQKTRPLREIEDEKAQLPLLYISHPSGVHVMDKAGRGIFVDPGSNEICYQPHECLNPNCPGRTADGQPFLFVHHNPLVAVGADGEIEYELPPDGVDPDKYVESKGGRAFPTCPECLKQRDLKSESAETAQQYRDWVQPHVPAETIKRRQELEEEYQRAYDALQERRRG